MMKIGLTGGIGSGKTTIATYFLELGIAVYFADAEAKKLMNTSKELQKKIKKAFGEASFKEGVLNRVYLAAIVFKNPEKLEILNGIVHPAVAAHFSNWVAAQKTKYIIQENAILFENNTAANFDFIITVTAPIEVRVDRVMKRDRTTKKEVLLRMANQWDDSKKIEQSDFVIQNVKLKDTKAQVQKIHKEILKLCKQTS